MTRYLWAILLTLFCFAGSAFAEEDILLAQGAVPTEVVTITAQKDDVPLTESFALQPGDSLWKHAMQAGVARKDWPEYWKSACVLSKIACEDEAWRVLPVGKVITAVRTDEAIAYDRERAALRREVAELRAGIDQLRALNAQLIAERDRERSRAEERARTIAWILASIVAGMLILVALHAVQKSRHGGGEKIRSPVPETASPVPGELAQAVASGVTTSDGVIVLGKVVFLNAESGSAHVDVSGSRYFVEKAKLPPGSSFALNDEIEMLLEHGGGRVKQVVGVHKHAGGSEPFPFPTSDSTGVKIDEMRH